MLTVICGEDITTSRNAIHELKKKYSDKGFQIESIPAKNLEEVHKNSDGVMGLFGQQSVYFVDNLSTALGRKKKGSFPEAVQALIANKDIYVIDWEQGKSAYNLTSLKKQATEFKEYKPEKSIFQLLDACYPGNMKTFLSSMNVVNETQDASFIYAMLCKHVRNIILAKENALGNMSPWQKKGLYSLGNKWEMKRLIGFYEGLAKIDIALKTNATPFDVKKSLEILVCYYL